MPEHTEQGQTAEGEQLNPEFSTLSSPAVLCAIVLRTGLRSILRKHSPDGDPDDDKYHAHEAHHQLRSVRTIRIEYQFAATEGKVARSAVGKVLSQIWEEDFLGFSYGLRPGRGQRDALDAISDPFSTDCGMIWPVRFVGHRTGDKSIVRLIQKWLKSGVVEDGKWFQTATPTFASSILPRCVPLFCGIH